MIDYSIYSSVQYLGIYDSVKKRMRCTAHGNQLTQTMDDRPQMTVVCRRQYNEIYFHELFLAAHFSRKFKKPSDKVPTVNFLLCDDIIHFATYLVK